MPGNSEEQKQSGEEQHDSQRNSNQENKEQKPEMEAQ